MGVIASIYKGTGIGGALLYVLAQDKGPDQGKPRILGASYVEGETAEELSRSFGQYRRIAGPGKDVWDVPFSYRREEAPDPLTREAYAQEWIQRMGLGDCPWVLVEHQDAERNINDHLVLLAVDGKGQRVHQAWDWTRSNRICGELDQRFGLMPENRTKRVEDLVLTPDAPGGKLELAALQFGAALDRAKAAGGSWRALDQELRRGGYELVVITHEKGKLAGQVKGIGVRDLVDEGNYFNGSELSRKWSYGKLQDVIKGDILKELGHEHKHATEVGARAPGVEPEPRDLGPGDRVLVHARVPGEPGGPAPGTRRGPEGRGPDGAAEADPGKDGRQARRQVEGAGRNGGRRQAGGGLLPGDAAGLEGLRGGARVPGLVAPTLRGPSLGAPGLAEPVRDPGGRGDAAARSQAGGRLAAAGLPVGHGAGGPAAGDPPVGDPLPHDSHVGGGPDVADTPPSPLRGSALPSGGGRTAAGHGPRPGSPATAAQAGLHDAGDAADERGPDAPGGIEDLAPAPGSPFAGGVDRDDMTEWGALPPIQVQLLPMREIANEDQAQRSKHLESPVPTPKDKKKERDL